MIPMSSQTDVAFNAFAECLACHGTGSFQRVVTCPECRWWTKLEFSEGGRCGHHNTFYSDTFGCTRWDARDEN